MTPRIVDAYIDAYNKQLPDIDAYMHQMGLYVFYAVSDAVGFILNGKKHKQTYPDKPFMQSTDGNDKPELTDDELEEIAMREEIRKMNMWIANDRSRGLPETIVD